MALTPIDQHKINDALQSNYQTLTLLTDPYKFNAKVLELQSYVMDMCKDRTDSEYLKINDAIHRILCLSLDISTQATYTGRCLNGVLNPSASVHTKQPRIKQSIVRL